MLDSVPELCSDGIGTGGVSAPTLSVGAPTSPSVWAGGGAGSVGGGVTVSAGGVTGSEGVERGSSAPFLRTITIQSNIPPSSCEFISRTSNPKRDFWETYKLPFKRVVGVTITFIGSVSLIAAINDSSNYTLTPAPTLSVGAPTPPSAGVGAGSITKVAVPLICISSREPCKE